MKTELPSLDFLRPENQHLGDAELTMYVSNRLTPHGRGLIEAHLRECEACRELAEAVLDALRQFEAGELSEVDQPSVDEGAANLPDAGRATFPLAAAPVQGAASAVDADLVVFGRAFEIDGAPFRFARSVRDRTVWIIGSLPAQALRLRIGAVPHRLIRTPDGVRIEGLTRTDAEDALHEGRAIALEPPAGRARHKDD